MRDRDVIDAFVVHLHDHGYPGLRVDRRPDEENRGSSDIDAIAGPFAIEHTSIDTLPHQRRDADWFMQAAGGLEQQLDQLPFLLRIVLQYDAVSKGQDWLTIRRKPGIEEKLNLQRDGSQAKVYQVRQVRAVILKYRLGGTG